jgi:hypothetical protein
LDLTESPARLLIGQQFLQADNLPRQLGNAFLRGFDDRQSGLEIGEIVMGQFAVLLQAVPDSTAKILQPFLDGTRQSALLRLKPLRKLRLRRDLALGQLHQTPLQ